MKNSERLATFLLICFIILFEVFGYICAEYVSDWIIVNIAGLIAAISVFIYCKWKELEEQVHRRK